MLVEMKKVRKVFGEVVALNDVDFSIEKGRIHGLLGENGAGKTTLMNILYGYYQMDHGEITFEGRPVKIHSPEDAIRVGIGMVHQLATLVREFTAVENIILGTEGKRLSFSFGSGAARHFEALRRDRLELSVARQSARTLGGHQAEDRDHPGADRGAKLIILDEPTTFLVESEFDQLLKSVKKLNDQGITVIFITHKIREVLKSCESVTVLRKGKIEGNIDRSEMNRENLVKMMFIEKDIMVTESALPRVQLPDCPRSESPVPQRAEPLGGGGRKRGRGEPRLLRPLWRRDSGRRFGLRKRREGAGGGVDPPLAGEGRRYPGQGGKPPGTLDSRGLRPGRLLHSGRKGPGGNPGRRHDQGKRPPGTSRGETVPRHNLFVNWEEAGKAARKVIDEYGVYTPSEDFLIRACPAGISRR